ncbi:uncharacterized protein LOC120334625 isoform X2 [Styela clava]
MVKGAKIVEVKERKKRREADMRSRIKMKRLKILEQALVQPRDITKVQVHKFLQGLPRCTLKLPDIVNKTNYSKCSTNSGKRPASKRNIFVEIKHSITREKQMANSKLRQLFGSRKRTFSPGNTNQEVLAKRSRNQNSSYPSPRSILKRKLEERKELRDVDIIHSESEDSRRSSDSYYVKKKVRFSLTPSSSFFKENLVNSKIQPSPSNKNSCLWRSQRLRMRQLKPDQNNILGKSHSPEPSDKIIPPSNEKPGQDNILGLSFNKKQQKKTDNITKTQKVSNANRDSSCLHPSSKPTRIMTRKRCLKHTNLSDKHIWADILNRQNTKQKSGNQQQNTKQKSGNQQQNTKQKPGNKQQNTKQKSGNQQQNTKQKPGNKQQNTKQKSGNQQQNTKLKPGNKQQNTKQKSGNQQQNTKLKPGNKQQNTKQKSGNQKQNNKHRTLKQFIQQTNFKPVLNERHITDELEIVCLGKWNCVSAFIRNRPSQT